MLHRCQHRRLNLVSDALHRWQCSHFFATNICYNTQCFFLFVLRHICSAVHLFIYSKINGTMLVSALLSTDINKLFIDIFHSFKLPI